MKKARDLKGWYKLRWEVLARDQFTCQYCGQSAPNAVLEVDHRISLADGGTDDLDNLATSCWACNRGKSGLRQSIILRRQRREQRIKDLPARQKSIFALLKDRPGLKAKQIADVQNARLGSVCMALLRLARAGKVFKKDKAFFIS